MAHTKIAIDGQFKSLLRPLTDDELATLERDLVAHGCREPLYTWRGILLDGHNRMQICDRLKISYTTREVDLPDRAAARAWIIANQTGRRNLTPDEAAYFRGKRYLDAKQDQTENLKKPNVSRTATGGGSAKPQQNHTEVDATAEKVAKAEGVSTRTVERDAQFAKAVDTLPEPEKKAVLSGKSKATRSEVVAVAHIPDPKKRARVAKAIVAGEELSPDEQAAILAGEVDQVCDELGNAIKDPKIAEAFAGRTKLRGTVTEIERLCQSVKALSGQLLAHWLDPQDAIHPLRDAKRIINNAMPYALVPPAVKEKKYRDVGFLTKDQYERGIADAHKWPEVER